MLLAAIGAGFAAAAVVVHLVYARDLRAARLRVASGAAVVETRLGPVEFASWGEGPAVLVVHGAGGGHDQGRLIARAFGGDGFRWIAPSRFGYLRSPLPQDASPAAQADVFAALLDAIGIDRAGVLAMSGGVPPALQFARRHPGRAAALVLIASAPVTQLGAAGQSPPAPAWVYDALFASDFPYWLLQTLAPGRLEAMFDAPNGPHAGLPPDEAAFLAAMVAGFQPVSLRAPGLANEVAAIDAGLDYALAGIATPALVIHARDDGINPFAIGAEIAREIPGAEFMPLPSGGHLLLGRHDEVAARVRAFLRRGAGNPARRPASPTDETAGPDQARP